MSNFTRGVMVFSNSANVDADESHRTQAALRGFFALSDKWQLTRDQSLTLLGRPSASTYHNWKKQKATSLSHDTLERISYLLGIHKSLRILFSRNPESVDAWIKKPNYHPLFAGSSALEKMLSGSIIDLYIVRQFLDSQRGEWN